MENTAKTKKILSIVFSIITIVGSIGVGIAIMLSEILYPEIEEFFECPPWYQNFMWISLALAVIGAIGCGIIKKTDDDKKIARYKKEKILSLIVFFIGIILCFSAAMEETEHRVLDYIICIGGALASLGLFYYIGMAIAYKRSKKKKVFTPMLNRLSYANPLIQLKNPADEENVLLLETRLNKKIPNDLKIFYQETDGDGDLMFSIKETLETTELTRKSFSEYNEKISGALCFAGDGCGNYFCYLFNNAEAEDNLIYSFNHETLELTPVTDSLSEFIYSYYNGY